MLQGTALVVWLLLIPDTWFEKLVRLATDATLFVVNIEKVSAHIELELDWISEPGRKGRALIVAPAQVVGAVRSMYPGIEGRHWLVERSARKTGIGGASMSAPEPVLQVARSVAGGAKPSDNA